MKIINLEGKRHRDIYFLLERPCTEKEVPFVVITGNSKTMKKIVKEVASTFGLLTQEKIGSSERVIICESR